MIWTLFIIGVLVAMGGFGLLFANKKKAILTAAFLAVVGFGGACLAVLAIFMRHWGF